MRYIEDVILVKLMGLLQESGMSAAILGLVIFGVLFGYAVGTLRVLLWEVRDLKAEVREVGAGVRELKTQAQEDRRVNKSDHDRPFNEVSDLKADVKVLRNRSDRSSADAG